MTTTPDTATSGLRARIDAAIRPTMLLGLQDAELHDAAGAQRIGEWVDWISETVAADLDRHAAEVRAAAHDQAADAVVELRDTTDVNVAEYQRYDFRQRVALGDAERKLRRMAAAARPDNTRTEAGPTEPPTPRCAQCRHPKRDHSDRRDHKPSSLRSRRPWCHACDDRCDYDPARPDNTGA